MSGTAEPASSKGIETFLVSCIDPRMTDETAFMMAALGRSERYSEMRIAGAALAAVDDKHPAWGQALWENLAASRALHGVRKITFVNHRDCGAMHQWAGRRLADDPAEELRVHAEVLNRAAEEVRRRHPDLLIEIKLMDLDGGMRVLPCPACVPRGLRAEAVSPAAGIIAAASLGAGAALPPPTGEQALTRDPNGFADLVRVRLAGSRQPDPSDELALLSEGVTRYGLTARESQEIRASVAAAQGQPAPAVAERDTIAFLRTRQDAQGRVGKADVQDAAKLYRRLVGAKVTAAEADRRATQIAERDGMQPRPAGIWPFRSTAWFRRMGGQK